ncbi:hypothetical protein QBC47DRAFT_355819 [Echria macrotheca]|uniref:Uncharacterized protein n=1 Tax=Echria macrotheca TaxID=438768 RepID=A0AAJ0BLU9_9PEZI|nr:hypothetical protein QBC47DRAFT_355819 [Echria macrotheca]
MEHDPSLKVSRWLETCDFEADGSIYIFPTTKITITIRIEDEPKNEKEREAEELPAAEITQVPQQPDVKELAKMVREQGNQIQQILQRLNTIEQKSSLFGFLGH